MTRPRKVVAVTGSSGQIGAKLLEHLEETPGLGRLVAIDTEPLSAPVHNISAFRHDITKPLLRDGVYSPVSELLREHGVTTLVHLAYARRGVMTESESDANDRAQRNTARYRRNVQQVAARAIGSVPQGRPRVYVSAAELNLEFLDTVINCCREAEIGHLIYLSSHCVYGAQPDNPLPLNEDTPLNPSAGFAYAQDNYNAEQRLLEFAEARPDMKITVFRSCPVLDTMAVTELLREMYFPRVIRPSEYNPPLQFVHGDDLARILCQAVSEELTGVYNVAGDGVVFLNELASAMPIKQLRLPAALANPLRRLAGGASSSYGHQLDRWPALMSTAKLRRTTGYQFRHDAQAALASFVIHCEELPQRLPKPVATHYGPRPAPVHLEYSENRWQVRESVDTSNSGH